MKGTIRARGKCPKCQKPFTDVSKGISMHRTLGIICIPCRSIPQRFYIDLHHQGQRIRIFTDKTRQPLETYQRAVILLSHINYEIRDCCFDPSEYIKKEQVNFGISKLLDRFYSCKIVSIAPSYRRHYKRYTEIAKDFFSSKDVRAVRRIDLFNYKEHIEKQFGLSGKTIKNILDLFKTFLLHCKNDWEILNSVPSFPDIEVPEYSHTWVSQDDQISLFGHIPDRHKPIIAFLMLHGCRPSEARALKCKNVDLNAGTIKISATFSGNVYREKTDERRSKCVTVPIHPEMYEYIADRVRNNLPEAFIFVNPRTGRYYSTSALDRVWFRARKDAGLGNGLRLCDATRHSFASQLVKSGTSLFKVSRLLGHSSVKMTEKYTRHNIELLKADINQLSLKEEEPFTHISTK